jgi:hypothetical protein
MNANEVIGMTADATNNQTQWMMRATILLLFAIVIGVSGGWASWIMDSIAETKVVVLDHGVRISRIETLFELTSQRMVQVDEKLDVIVGSLPRRPQQ